MPRGNVYVVGYFWHVQHTHADIKETHRAGAAQRPASVLEAVGGAWRYVPPPPPSPSRRRRPGKTLADGRDVRAGQGRLPRPGGARPRLAPQPVKRAG
jgi:hypothetical protein